VRERAMLERSGDHCVQLGHAVRLGQITEGPPFHRVHGRVDRALCRCNHDCRRVGIIGKCAQHLESIRRRHHTVEDRDIKGLRSKRTQCSATIAHARDAVSKSHQMLLEDSCQLGLVLGDEYVPCDAHCGGHRPKIQRLSPRG
jgi:hypothetical protein